MQMVHQYTVEEKKRKLNTLVPNRTLYCRVNAMIHSNFINFETRINPT